MQQSRPSLLLTRLVAFIVLVYGLEVVADSLLRQLQVHRGHTIDLFLISVPQIAGLGLLYLGTLLLRRKRNAWAAAIAVFSVLFLFELPRLLASRNTYGVRGWERLLLPILMLVLLLLTRNAFTVKSDVRSFRQALRISLVVLLVAFLYGVGGFSLLDDHDFHQEISLITAAHYTIDQFGLTTNHPVAHTRRARYFLDSLSVISVTAVVYTAISLFEPIRVRFANQVIQRSHAARLLTQYPSDLDDYFKLWPHDKLYYFDESGEAGVAYHVTRGTALVVSNPFGNPKQFKPLMKSFLELCFVNDWVPAFIHVDSKHRTLYEETGFRLQKIGEEAVLDLWAFEPIKADKYFRQIRNRFERIGYSVEVVIPPHSGQVIARLQEISLEWLERPGRAERGFMLGYFNETYLQAAPLALLHDENGRIQGFLNLVPTFEAGTANYDLLRCANDAPGNANDFLMLGTIEYLKTQGVRTLNLGLCPLSGVDEPDSDDTTLVDQALRFVYANGDRLYSFSGLRKFKSKYQPTWEPRYIAYPGRLRTFTRVVTALNRAMKVK